MCQFLNHESTDTDLLINTVGISKKAANNVMSYRNGLDALLGTVDDNPFDSVNEVDAVRWVGPSALSNLSA